MRVNINNNRIRVLESVYINDISKYNTISDAFKVCDRFSFRGYLYKGFSISTNDDINEVLRSNRTDNLESKAIFVDKLCKIPTFDLTQNNIVRKRDWLNADICVVPKANFDTLYNAVVLFNGIDYIISNITILSYAYWNVPLAKHFEHIHFNKPIDLIESLLADDAPYLEGYKVVYEGTITLADKNNIHFLMDYDKYHNTISEQEYLKYISSNKEDITLDVIEQIDKVCQGGSFNDVSMFLTMMTTYNTDPYIYEITKMLIKYRYIIKESKVQLKVAFITFLGKYGITFRDIEYNQECRIINGIWHLMSEKQKEGFMNNKIEIAKKRVKDSFQSVFESFTPFNNYEFKIEVTSNEANFSFTRES